MSETPLIDEIYRKLNAAGERAAFNGFKEPKFQIYLTVQQIRQLRQEALKAKYPVYTFSQSSPNHGEFLFGHRIIVADETPYLRLVE